MTNDLISRSELLLEMAAGCVPLDEKGISGVTGDESTIYDYIKNAPAVDAAQVVRCKDCVHSAVDSGTGRLMCVRMGEIRPNGHVWGGTGVNETHFCGYGVNVNVIDDIVNDNEE